MLFFTKSQLFYYYVIPFILLSLILCLHCHPLPMQIFFAHEHAEVAVYLLTRLALVATNGK